MTHLCSFLFNIFQGGVTYCKSETVTVFTNTVSTAVSQAAACAPVTQRARVRFPVGTGFLGEVFSRFFFTCKTNVGKL